MSNEKNDRESFISLRKSSFYKNLVLFVKPIIWLIFITVLCLLPIDDLPDLSGLEIPYFDKIIHFGMYFIFSILMVRPLKTIQRPVWLFTLIVTLVVGGTIELFQLHITNYRSASWFDFLADVIGAITGLILYKYISKVRHFERWF